MDVIIYHNPECGTSRNTLALIRHCDVEPHVVEYLKTQPSRSMLVWLLKRANLPVRAVLRQKGTPYDDLNLGDPRLSEDQLFGAVLAYPILLNRPLVVTPKGVKLCRPSEAVLDLLPPPPPKIFRKEEGDLVLDASGKRIIT